MITSIFLLWRFGLFFIAFLGSRTFPLVANSSPGAIGEGKIFNYWLSWAQWDGGNYLTIAQNGYTTVQNFAFAPLFPFLAKVMSFLFFGNIFLAGIILSNTAFLGFLFVFYHYAKTNYSKNVAYSSLVSFLVFPTTFFAVSFYSESLFLLLAAIAFTLLAANKFIHSAVVIAAASLARFIGALLIISLFYSYFESIKFKLKEIGWVFAGILISFLGIASFMFYAKTMGHESAQFISSQIFWKRAPADPVSTILSYLWSIITFKKMPINDYFDFASTAFFLMVLAFSIKKIKPALWIFSVLAILIPASTGTLSSMPRYLLASLGTFIVFGRYLEEHSNLKVPFWTASLAIQSILVVLFINGYWVA